MNQDKQKIEELPLLMGASPLRDSNTGSSTNPSDDEQSLQVEYVEQDISRFEKVRLYFYNLPNIARQNMTRENLMLLFYLVGVVLIGTANRVTFKIMQYSSFNYSYFDSQLTTFVYVPVNFAVIGIKLLFFKNHITPSMRDFPKWKFAIMGFLDSLQGLLIVVGGVQVPGIMQNLLLQGAVPVTMLFSLAMLRNTGCQKCSKARAIINRKKIAYKEELAPGGRECTKDQCVSRLAINGMDVADFDGILQDEMGDVLETNIARRSNPDIVFYSSGTPWRIHLRSYYSIPQYVGALVILGGLVVSVWPALNGSGGAGSSGGPPLWDFVFFLANIPTAISSVYKEIAFHTNDDMDVWWLNGWVALFQFLFGLLYAPVAAVMNVPKIPLDQIGTNLWDGLICFLLEHNTIVPGPEGLPANLTAVNNGFIYPCESNLYDCSTALNCGPPCLQCCDSCDGSIPTVSAISAPVGTSLYMIFNIAYNIFLLAVIKYGSAALMYIASTIVLPLGSLAFTSHLLLGDHAQPFTVYNGAGLGVVLLGLIIYRFVGSRKRTRVGPDMIDGSIAFSLHAQPLRVDESQLIKPRSIEEVRTTFYRRLGLDERVMPNNFTGDATVNS